MDDKKQGVLGRLIEYIDHNGLDVQTYPGVVEPGYDDVFMIAADWNGPSSCIDDKWDWENTGKEFVLTKNGRRRARTKRIGDFIERYFEGDVVVEWNDEWTGCYECGKAFRMSPDCYSWLPYYVMGDGWIMCGDCAKENVEDCLAEYIDSQDRAIMDWMMKGAGEAGFVCALDDPWFGERVCRRFQTGWHEHQNDTPKKALEELYLLCDEDVKKGKRFFEDKYEHLFAITGKGQFDIDWTVLIREREVNHG